MLRNGQYVRLLDGLSGATDPLEAFMVCAFGHDEIDHNYEYVIKPLVMAHGISMARVDEVAHLGHITAVIIERLRKCSLVIADLTHAKPNCYYELGFAHALDKPVILLAKAGTERPFDVADYRWLLWTDYKDLKQKFEKELSVIVASIIRAKQALPQAHGSSFRR